MSNSHRAVIQYPCPPTIEIVASGPLDFCQAKLAEYLAKYPVTPFDEGESDSGGVPLVLEVVTAKAT